MLRWITTPRYSPMTFCVAVGVGVAVQHEEWLWAAGIFFVGSILQGVILAEIEDVRP